MWKIAKPSRINLDIEKRILGNAKKDKENSRKKRIERKRERDDKSVDTNIRRRDRKRKKEQGLPCGHGKLRVGCKSCCNKIRSSAQDKNLAGKNSDIKNVEIIDLTKE